MTRTEDRIRDALGALADLAPAADASRTGPETTGAAHSVPRAGRRRRLRRLYMPAAAAAGTALVVVLAFVLVPLGSGTRSGSDFPGASPAVTPPAAASARPTGPPPASPKPDPARAGRFFAVMEYDRTLVPKTVTIRDAADGHVTAGVAVPKGVQQWYSLSGTAVPGLFYLAGYTESGPFRGQSTIYRLTIDDRGRFSALTPVGVDGSLPFIIRSLAASPDGTRIAFPVNLTTNDHRLGRMRLDVADVTSGKRTTFQSGVTGRLAEVSWDAAGRYLGFLGGDAPQNDRLWVLDTSAAGDLFARSRKVPFAGLDAGPPYTGIVLGADARRFYLVSAVENVPVVEVDVRTGGHRQIVRTRVRGPWGNDPLARSPAGTDLLLVEDRGVCHRISLATFAVIDFRCDGRPAAVAW
jgi:hypothetical protein